MRKNKYSKPVSLVLGGTNPHIELIENLKLRGYHTVLVDYYESPPAKFYADQHIQESTLDQAKVLEIAKNLNAALVISTCVDQANVTACYVADRLGLPAPYSYKTAVNVANKGYMKKVLAANGIHTSKYIFVDSVAQFDESGLKFPVIVKPADSCGSSGVKRVNRREELEKNFDFALKISRAGKAIIEEVIEGKEISAYCFIKKKQAHVIMVSQRLSVIDGEDKVIKCYATITPPDISTEAYIFIKEAAEKIADIFNLDNTPFHLQAFVNENYISIIEFAPRAGGGMSFRTIKENTGFDIIDSTIDSFLGIDMEIHYRKPERYYSINLIYANEGIFDHVKGHDELFQQGIINEIYQYKTKGSVITTDTASRSRIGSYIIKADTKAELFSKMNIAINNLQVYDPSGISIMNKRVYRNDWKQEN